VLVGSGLCFGLDCFGHSWSLKRILGEIFVVSVVGPDLEVAETMAMAIAAAAAATHRSRRGRRRRRVLLAADPVLLRRGLGCRRRHHHHLHHCLAFRMWKAVADASGAASNCDRHGILALEGYGYGQSALDRIVPKMPQA